MKNKKWISLAAAVVLAVTALPMGVFAAKKDSTEEKLTKVTLNEVAHSIFYAPQYVAIEEGYFKDEGLDLTLVTGFGADKTMTAVISGEADIGFMGAEASIYAYQEGATDPVVNFAQLTQRAGNFLVAREEMPDFKWEDLKDKKVLGGRKGGMPEMVFEYILRKNGLDPQKDLTIDQSIDFGSTAAAFTGDTSADFTVEFEPSATALEKEGAGYVVASLGVDSGYVPYTSYSAKTSYMEKNPEIIQKFTNALQKGMEYVQSHTPEEIAEEMEIPVEKVMEIQKIAQDPVSLETPIGEEDDSHLGDFIQDDDSPAPHDSAAYTLLKEQLEEVMNTLTPREAKVLKLRFGLEDGKARTLEEVGRQFQVTRERIRQIEAKALRKLRHPSRSKKLRDYMG